MLRRPYSTYRHTNIHLNSLPSNAIRLTYNLNRKDRLFKYLEYFRRVGRVLVRPDRTRDPKTNTNVYFKNYGDFHQFTSQISKLDIGVYWCRLNHIHEFSTYRSYITPTNIFRIYSSDFNKLPESFPKLLSSHEAEIVRCKGGLCFKAFCSTPDSIQEILFSGGILVDEIYSKTEYQKNIGSENCDEDLFYADLGYSLAQKNPYLLIERERLPLQNEGMLIFPNMFRIKFQFILTKSLVLKKLDFLKLHSVDGPDKEGFFLISLASYESFIKLHKMVNLLDGDVSVFHHGLYSERSQWNINKNSIIIKNIPQTMEYDCFLKTLNLHSDCRFFITTCADEKSLLISGPEDKIFFAWFNNGLIYKNRKLVINHVFSPSKIQNTSFIIADSQTNKDLIASQYISEANIGNIINSHFIDSCKAKHYYVDNLSTLVPPPMDLSRNFYNLTTIDHSYIYRIKNLIEVIYNNDEESIENTVKHIADSSILEKTYIPDQETHYNILYMVCDGPLNQLPFRNGQELLGGIVNLHEYIAPLIKRKQILARNELLLVVKNEAHDLCPTTTFNHYCWKAVLLKRESQKSFYKLYIKSFNDFHVLLKKLRPYMLTGKLFPQFIYRPTYSETCHNLVLIKNIANSVTMKEINDLISSFIIKVVRKIPENNSSYALLVNIEPDPVNQVFFLNGFKLHNLELYIHNHEKFIDKRQTINSL